MPLERHSGAFFIYPNTLRKARPPYFKLPERGNVVKVVRHRSHTHYLQNKRVSIAEFFNISQETADLLGLNSVK